jgi:ATP-dependent helicase HrpB
MRVTVTPGGRGREKMSETLPIDDVLDALVGALRSHSCVVVQAPTGAGKTTRVPPAVLDRVLCGRGQVVVLEPRRVAARAAARRMAQERGVALGQEVGYQVRFERVASSRTSLLVVTEGVLVRMLQEDPFLEGVGAIIFDEFHERSLDADLALAMARRVQGLVREELRLVVMSATLDAAPVARWLGGCPVITSDGRSYPVEIRHAGHVDLREIHEGVARGVREAASLTGRHVLAFLPGVGEIQRTREALGGWARAQGVGVVGLYGQLSAQEQDAALAPGGSQRVILATNVAETSLTIPGVGAVVDSGLARVMRYDPGCGLDRLELRRISRASADQRAGRAGREAPGLCLRLWGEAAHLARPAFEDPEIRRIDMSGPLLQLMAWDEGALEGFGWFEAPPAASVARGLGLLALLGAASGGRVTARGRALARWPLHPRLASLLVAGHGLGHVRAAALAAALLSERDPFPSSGASGGRAGDSDLMERLRSLERRGPLGLARPEAARQMFQVRDQLLGIAQGALGAAPSARCGEEEAVGRALLAGFPDRVAQRREAGSPRGRMVGGGGVRLHPSSVVVEAPLFVCVSLDAGPKQERAEAVVRVASAVERGWLAAQGSLREEVEVLFDPSLERVVSKVRVRFGDLTLEERAGPAPSRAEAAPRLLEAALASPGRAIPWEEAGLARWLARVRALARWRPELGLPAFDAEEVGALLAQQCEGARSFEELRRQDWLSVFRGALRWEQLQVIEREAPEALEVPSGSQIRLQYPEEGPPVLAVRIQEMFGLAETPRVAGGRVPVLLHLLAPNHRPQQVTQDLRSFWATTYAEVRRELRQRYPKHAWPEDPWSSPPERRPKRRVE